MFEKLSQAPADAIVGLIAEYAADPRSDKIDLGVGVYRDDKGETPVMRAVRAAEERVHAAQTTKTYLGMAGAKPFNAVMAELVLGSANDPDRVRVAQSVGGTGALRILADLIARARQGSTVWLSDPTWPNHKPIVDAAGLRSATYPYFDTVTKSVRFEAMFEALGQVPAGDTVLLHGCCHNPTGANLNPEQWDRIADLLAKRGVFVLLDLAYLGFGDGLEEDAYGVRKLASHLPELAIAASCSKNFGLYRDRVGAAILVAQDAAAADIAQSQLLSVVRANYSMPPDHGAAVVAEILTDPDLRADWEAELTDVRDRMIALRQDLADALRQRTNSDRFDFLAEHRGMFSLCGLTPETVARLKKDAGIYMVGSSRINVAGLRASQIPGFADAIARAISAD